MAYKMSDVGGWGTGALGDITNPAGQINSYANVTAISTNTVTIGTPSAGIYETFAVGKEILLHVSAVLSGTDATKLGKYLVATITGVSGSVLTLSKDVAANLVANADLTTLVVQAITVAQFNILTLSSGSITPPAYSTTNKYGGIITYKCKTEQIFSGGSISLVDKGIPTASSAMRPLTAQETEIATGNKNTIGWENHLTVNRATLNCGDGALLIWTKKTTISGISSRFGGTAAGTQGGPYGTSGESPATSLGGSTLLFVSETILGFDISLISKTRGSGTGYGRCHIVTNTKLNNDGGLYSLECLHDAVRLRSIGITDYGTGALGDITNPAGQINSYARITSFGTKQVVIGASSVGAYGGFDPGTTVVIHIAQSPYAERIGLLFKTTILDKSGSIITLADEFPFVKQITNADYQLITVPQFNNLTISAEYNKALTWNATNKIGGILLLSVKNELNLSDGIINMAGKGMTSRQDIPTQGNGQQGDYLPISATGGAVMLLAKTLRLNTNSRIGGTWSGTLYGGQGTAWGGGRGRGIVYSGGYAKLGDGYAQGGIVGKPGYQGAQGYPGVGGTSILCITDTIINFALSAFSTGGTCGSMTMIPSAVGSNGGAGYGGGGIAAQGWEGIAGGGAGSLFIYANTLINPDYTGVVI